MKTNEERKKEILEILKKEKEIQTGKIAFLTGTNFYLIEKLLKELEKEKKIQSIKVNKGNYWKLK